MEREKKSFNTPSGKEVIVRTYITGREANTIKAEMLKNMKLDLAGNRSGEVSGDVLIEQEKKLLNILVISIDGKTENVIEMILDLPNSDYQSIIKELNEIYTGNLTPAK